MVRRATQLAAIAEPQANDVRGPVPHDRDRLRGSDAGSRSLGGRAVAIHTNLLAGLRSLEKVRDRQKTGRRVHTRIAREARIRSIDATRDRRGVPVIDRRVELHAGIAARPGGFGDLTQKLAARQRLEHLAVSPGREVPRLAGERALHEVIGRAYRVVRVLELDRLPRLAVEAHVIAHLAEGPGLLLFLGLAPDEVV